jgi:flagellar biosynthesis regulator FlbT
MLAIIAITLIIGFVAIKLSHSTKKECVDIYAKRILRSSARTAIRRNCRRKEIVLANEKQRMIKQALKEMQPTLPGRKLSTKVSVMPIEEVATESETVEVPQQVPVMANAGADNNQTQGQGSMSKSTESTESEKVFSPSKWWEINYKKMKSYSDEKAILPKEVLPEESLWGSIGRYILKEEDYSDYTITEEGILFK